jgi:acetoin utilization protein AcuB
MQVSELMTPSPRTLDVTATVRDAVVLMNELDVRHLPVMDEGDLVGIISDRDVKSALGAEATDVDAYARQLDSPVSRLMSSYVITVGPEDELGDAIDVMLENRLGNVPVIAEDPPTLVGVLSYVDILRAARDAL